MSPLAGCPTCGAPGCQRHRRKPAPRRGYSDTAAYREALVEVLGLHGQRCVLYCGEAIADEDLVLAHVIDHADGGQFVVENLRPAHRSCNARAGGQRTQEATHG